MPSFSSFFPIENPEKSFSTINEVKPIAAEIDETERFPMENVEKMAKLGMLGIPFSKEYGGAGGDTLSYILT
ncbi:hypothetical protein GNF86_22055, partial [Clostridium perfringens]